MDFRINRVNFDGRIFRKSAQRLWNDIPVHFTSTPVCNSLSSFKYSNGTTFIIIIIIIIVVIGIDGGGVGDGGGSVGGGISIIIGVVIIIVIIIDNINITSYDILILNIGKTNRWG